MLSRVFAALPDYSAGILDVASVRAAAETVTAERFPNADDVLVDDYIVTEYQADGTAETYDDTFVKVLTEKGKEDNKTLTRHFTLPYSTASFKLVQVIKADGRVIPIDVDKQSRVMVDRSQMGANIYNPNSKVLSVTLPELDIGDMVRYVSYSNLVKPRVPNTWSDYQVLEYTSPIQRFVYEVRGPKSLPLKSIALKAEVPGTVEYKAAEQDGTETHTWTVTDVPRMYTEPNMPPLYTVVQRLLVSTIPDWETISRWYWNLSEPHFACTPAITEKTRELIAGIDDREERIRAIFKFVSQEVRYMGITVEKDAPGYEPHDVALTFENRHGVCRDKAALLVAMLREAGFKAYPVLIHNGPKKDEEVPQPYFNHAVSAVENDDGSYILMDSTDENTKDMFPAYLSNQSYLVAKPEGDRLRTSPIVPARKNMMLIETRCRVDDKGGLTGESTLQFEGINDNAYRGYFSRIEPAERRRYFEGVVKRVAAGARLTRIEITPKDMMDTDTPLGVQLEFAADDIVISDGETTMLPVPRLGHTVGMVNFILGNTGLDKRKYPFVNDVACGVKETLVVDLDPVLGAPVSVPEYPVIETETLSWHNSLAVAGRALRGESEFLITTVEFDPQEYLELKNTLATLEFNSRKKPIFRPGAPAEAAPAASRDADADARIISENWDYELAADNTWIVTHTVARQILSYKGKKDNAELKWDYNPTWHTVELKNATVETNGQTKTISEQEINLMDAGWVASAPRYPAAKTLVASLPGVEIGSIIRYKVVHTFHDRPLFAIRQSFRDFDTIDSKSVSLHVPRGTRLDTGVYDRGALGDVRSDGTVSSEYRREGGVHTLVWSAKGQPAVRRESRLPPWWAFNPTVFVSFGNWKDYARRVRPVLLNAARNQAAAAELGRTLTADTDGLDAALKAVRDYVSKNVRYAGPSFDDLPLSCVTPADVTLAEGYGNTTDRAVLIYAMLHGAGIDAEFVLASQGPREEELQDTVLKYPAMSTFPDVLVCVDSWWREIFLNDTDQYAAIGATPHDGCAGVWLDSGRIDTIEAEKNRGDRHETDCRIVFDDEGNARIDMTRTYFGDAYAAKNRSFSEMPPEERNRYYQKTLTALSQLARPAGDLVTSFDAYPGTESYSADVSTFAVIDGQYCYFNLPNGLQNLLGLRADERYNAVYWSGERRFRLVTDIVFPGQFTEPVLLPDTLEWEAPDGGGAVSVTLRRDLTDDQGRHVDLRLIHDVDLEPAVIPADRYMDLLELNRKLSHAEAHTILLKRP
jgi:transglutaminase-like putative cysteine protease